MTLDPGSTAKARKTLASFYTPLEVAQALTDWAITDIGTTVLDPSFGGCAFLHAALRTLRGLGNPAPGRQIYGVDVDPSAQLFLRQLLLADALPEQFVIEDFFTLPPMFFGGQQFGAVVGNPPYIRYHDIPPEEKERAIARLGAFGIQISGRASHWAYFLLYSMQFLCRGGRLAMILPGAFLHTDYAIQVRERLTQHFEQVAIYLLQERIFDGTDEESVLVCAAGARKPHRSLRIGTVRSIGDLEQALGNIVDSTRVLDKPDGDGQWLRALIEPKTLELYDQLVQSPDVIRMGEWVESRIGVVTGSNDFFTLSRSEQKQINIPDDYLVPIIRRAKHLKGLWVTDDDFQALEKNGDKYLLLALEQVEARLPKSLQDYIQHGEETGVSIAHKCRSRQPWYVVPRTFVPPAFMPCMSAAWPRLVVNRSEYTCTNNILRMIWKEEHPAADWLRLALGSVSTLCQMSAELVGRSYGGGVLKVEPTELSHLVVPVVPTDVVDNLARQVDSFLRQGEYSKATTAVDSALVDSLSDLTAPGLEQLRSARNLLFLRRRRHRNDAQKILSG